MSSYINDGDQLTSKEVLMVQNLHALVNSPSGQAVSKTGLETFANAVPSAALSLSILPATGAVNDANLIFGFTSLPSILVINGAIYQQTGGSITWTWNAITLQATLSSAVGAGGSIFGLV